MLVKNHSLNELTDCESVCVCARVWVFVAQKAFGNMVSLSKNFLLPLCNMKAIMAQTLVDTPKYRCNAEYVGTQKKPVII
jgi:hypothetical protein